MPDDVIGTAPGDAPVLRDPDQNLPDNIYDPHHLSLRGIRWISQVIATSGDYPSARSMSQVASRILTGAELGIGPMAALRGVYIVKGNPSLHYSLMGALIKQHPRYNYKVVDTDDTGKCVIEWFERDDPGDEYEPVGFSSFSMDEAKTAGVIKDNTPWQTYPKVMLFARALSIGARMYAPDALGGMVVYERESGEADESRFDAETTAVEVDLPDEEPTAPATQAEPPKPTVELATPTSRGNLWKHAQKHGWSRAAFDTLLQQQWGGPPDRMPAALVSTLRTFIEDEALRNDLSPDEDGQSVGQTAPPTAVDALPEDAQEPASPGAPGVAATTPTVITGDDDPGTCEIEGCEFDAAADGLCFEHYGERMSGRTHTDPVDS